MSDINVGDKVVCPDGQTGTVDTIGRVFVVVVYDNPPPRWQERCLSDRNKYRVNRLRKA